MKYLKNSVHLLLLAVVLVMAGCASSGGAERSRASASTGNDYMTLEDHLRRINGVRVTGSGNHAKVLIRGTRGISTVSRGLGTPQNKTNLNLRDDGDRTQPLFVVDGQKVGRDYPDVRDMLAPGSIESVRLLSESEASRYGSESGYGVISITTTSKANANKRESGR